MVFQYSEGGFYDYWTKRIRELQHEGIELVDDEEFKALDPFEKARAKQFYDSNEWVEDIKQEPVEECNEAVLNEDSKGWITFTAEVFNKIVDQFLSNCQILPLFFLQRFE